MAPGEQVPAVPPPPSGETTSTDAAQDQTPPNALVEFAREAWTQALVAVNATEEEVQRIVSRVSGWELSDKLRSERDQLEAGIESAVKKALMPFRVPSMEDLAALHARVSVLEARVDRLITRRQSA